MAIKSIDIENIMAFRTQWRKNNGDCNDFAFKEGDKFCEAFQLQFCDGINVIIGENGVGKTTLLKLIYIAAQATGGIIDNGKAHSILRFFSGNLETLDLLRSGNGQSYFKISDGKHVFNVNLSLKELPDYGKWFGLNIQSVFIPTTEMLSHSKGFLALDQKYKLPFDGTQVDIIVNTSLPETREVSPYMGKILEKISKVIDGTIVLEDDTFYVLKSDGRKVDFSLEAEGLRKLGLLWKLIRNGLLEEGTILLWDEPEANLNPELFPLVVEILLQLEEAGIQIFVATHSYNLAKYFEVRRTREEQVLYHNLYHASSKVASEYELVTKNSEEKTAVYSKSAYYLSQIGRNKIITADEQLLDEALKKGVAD